MIFNKDHIQINMQKKEFTEREKEGFPLAANEGDIGRYLAGCIPFHWHPELELFVLLKGTVRVSAGDASFMLEAGEGCFINTGVLHSFLAPGRSPCRYRSFVFEAGLASGMPGSVFDVKYIRPLLCSGIPFLKLDRGDRPYFEAFQAAFHFCEREPYGYEFCVREALSQLLLYISGKCPAAPPQGSPVQEERLKRMMEWTDENIEGGIKLCGLAAAVNICPRECQRIFGRYLHVSPMEYVRRRRIFLAADLLAASDEPVTDIALKCGFSSPSHFSSQFKRLVGRTPVEYRTAVRGGASGN